ncbi:MAG TPA: FAD-binding oxidoreductase [Candidatus Dormibacteraeota bacterium]
MVVDGLEPARVERPSTAGELAEALRAAAEAGESVVPVGGGRALGMGDPLERFDVALETRALDRVLEESQADLTISVEAGITVEALNARLAQVGQFLPIDPPGSPGHTVGGVLASGLSGPLRLRYGSPRDFVIGLRVALPDGRLASSGGRVVKNVSGYDLNKLHQGALGSLGVIVAASFKVFPRPLHERTLEARPDDPWAEAARALALPQPPIALELTGDGRLLARLAGTAAGVDRMTRALGWADAAPEVWEEHASRSGATWARISAPPARLRELVERLPEAAAWWASPGVGTAHWTGDIEAGPLLEMRAAAEQAGGALVLLAAPVELKRQVGAWGAPPATADWMRRLRDAFDPGRALSPGRYVV